MVDKSPPILSFCILNEKINQSERMRNKERERKKRERYARNRDHPILKGVVHLKMIFVADL